MMAAPQARLAAVRTRPQGPRRTTAPLCPARGASPTPPTSTRTGRRARRPTRHVRRDKCDSRGTSEALPQHEREDWGELRRIGLGEAPSQATAGHPRALQAQRRRSPLVPSMGPSCPHTLARSRRASGLSGWTCSRRFARAPTCCAQPRARGPRLAVRGPLGSLDSWRLGEESAGVVTRRARSVGQACRAPCCRAPM